MNENIVLSDDGTLDTVLVCRACGAEARYTYAACDDDATHLTDKQAYKAFVGWAYADFGADHECDDEDEG